MINQIFLLSGTPGTGKTTIAKLLFEQHSLAYLSLSELVIQQNLYSEVDQERNSKIVDETKLHAYIDTYIQTHSGDLLIEGHYADLIDFPQVQCGIVLRCHPVVLEKRLQLRKYTTAKVLENVQAEIVGDCASYMLDLDQVSPHHHFFEVVTSHITDVEAANLCYSIFQHPDQCSDLHIGKFSWLSDSTAALDKFLR